MRLLVCGDRDWPEDGPDAKIIDMMIWAVYTDPELSYDEFVLISGEAPGADTVAKNVASEIKSPDFKYEGYPAQWKIYGNGAGPIRNQQMLDTGVDLVLAFHNDISESKGTKDMLNRAKKAGVDCYLIGRY